MHTLKQYLVFFFKLSAAGLGFFANIFVNKISSSFPDWPLILFLVLLVIIYIYDWVRAIKDINPNIKADAIEDEADQKANARKGLIVFLSLYNNFKKKFSVEELEKHVKSLDYESLQLQNTSITNFGPAINAIKAHLPKLEHLWIVTTKAPLQSSPVTSLDYLPVMKEYIKKELDTENKINIYAGKDYSVSITNTQEITEKTYEQIRKIYKEAKSNYKLNAEDIIIDVTGGFVFMSIGGVLASLAKNQDVQVIGCKYDRETGRPVEGDVSYPVRIKYAPRFGME